VQGAWRSCKLHWH